MNYISIDVRLGMVGPMNFDNARLLFHKKVAELFSPAKGLINRVGLSHMLPFDYESIYLRPGLLAQNIYTEIEQCRTAVKSVDMMIIDLTSNRFDIIRDSILFHLADQIERLCTEGICRNHLVLLPVLPLTATASMKRLFSIQQSPSVPSDVNYRILVIDNTGGFYSLPRRSSVSEKTKKCYSKSIQATLENPQTRLERKVVRRLGHFLSPNHPQGGCRSYSYITDNCDEELLTLTDEWWRSNAIDCKVILSDTRNNPSFSIALKAFAERHEILSYTVHDVLMQSDIANKVKRNHPCLIALDVVETGNTLIHYVRKFNRIGVKVDKKVLTVLRKGGGNINTALRDFEITSFLRRPSEPLNTECIQCKLKLPHSAEANEDYLQIRSFDMWYMSNEVGWESEPEYPDNIGLPYKVVPKFPIILSKYGDWIAYKMEKRLKQMNYPDNLFVIHPDEPSSNSLSDRLQSRFEESLQVVRVPRDAIKRAQENHDSWGTVLGEPLTPEWVKYLRSFVNSSALIIDIFNGSGSTFSSLLALLDQLNIRAYCYFPFVDRDVSKTEERYRIAKYSLYDWYGPRELKLSEKEPD